MENQEIKEELSCPVLPLLERPLFPETFTTLIVGRIQDVATIKYVIDNGGYFIALYQEEGEDGSLRNVGTLSKITRSIKLPTKSMHLFISTIDRVLISSFEQKNGILFASYSSLKDRVKRSRSIKEASLSYSRILKNTVMELSQTTPLFTFASDVNVSNIDDESTLSYYVASSLSAPGEFLQEVLETTSAKERIEKLISHILIEKELIEKENVITQQLYERIKNHNKTKLIREKIKVLNSELREITGHRAGSDRGDIYDQVAEAKVPDIYREALDKELDKLSSMEPMNPDYAVSKFYIETILALPFSFENKEPEYDIKSVKSILEKDHYGLRDVKDRILEFLGSRLKAKNGKGAIICLAGPPGTGKTSVGFSIARALEKKFYRFSVGGMRDEAEIKGHRRTYVGAMPGKIIQAMKSVAVTDPVILIDEIDKMGESFKGDPASALLEVLDPEQNASFQDFYIDLPYDLSNVLFIVTANNTHRIPLPLLDRMEVIELSGYTPGEKYHIGKSYLVPRLLKKNGLTKNEISFDKTSLSLIAEEYAREAGVRNYEKALDKIMRKVALEILQNPDTPLPLVIDKERIEKYLGKPLFPQDAIVKADKNGTAIGLAWTSMGGDVLLIEADSIPAKGELKITGSLGDVMKESVSIAWSVLQKEAMLRGLDLEFFSHNTVHVHIPEGAVPKDGPSAGITLFTALWSMYRERTIKEGLAMTGELTLTGSVMPIGGLKEKILAAMRNGIKEIIIPKRNSGDLEILDKEVKGNIIFHTVDTISDVINIAFPDEDTKRLSKEKIREIYKETKE